MIEVYVSCKNTLAIDPLQTLMMFRLIDENVKKIRATLDLQKHRTLHFSKKKINLAQHNQ